MGTPCLRLPAAACGILLLKRIMWCARTNWNRALLLNFARQFFPLKLYLVTGIVTDTAANYQQNVSICRAGGGSRRQPYGYMETRLKKERNNRLLKSIISRSGFSKMVTCPTRIIKETTSLIDLILTNMPHNITKTIVLESGISDHCTIGTVRKLNSLRFKPRVISCRNYKHFNGA